MNQQIGNVGLLNLMNATAESIKGIEKIVNVGTAIYRQGNAHLLTSLNIGNIGSTVEIPEGYSLHNGNLNLNHAFLESVIEPAYLFVNGAVIVDKDVHQEDLKKGLLNLMVNGKVFSPEHLSGTISQIISKGSLTVESYLGDVPRFENGKFTLTNSFLESLEEPLYLIVNGVLTLPKDLDMSQFNEKIDKLRVNGKIILFEEQEAFLYKKAASLTTSKMEVIPTGYEVLTKPLRLNSRSIRRFRKKNLYTKNPILIDADVTRDMLEGAVTSIHSTSVIVCKEDVEDVIYELLNLLDTEVLSYENAYLLIEGEEVLSNDQLLAFEKPVNVIVDGKMTVDSDVTEEVLLNKVLVLDILGEIVVKDKRLKGVLQNLTRFNTGSIQEESTKEQGSGLYNVGELSL